MFHNVLVGVDGRPGGRDAIALARRLVDRGGAITLAHVHADEFAEGAACSRALLETERDAGGVDARLVAVAATGAGRGLHEQAETQDADLLVVGSCRRSTLGRVALGDDTRAALNGAGCAVAVAPHGYAAQRTSIATVGVAFDDSAESRVALAGARTLAAANGATIRALHVVSLPSTYAAYAGPAAAGEAIGAMLEAARAGLGELVGVEGRAVRGVPGEELAAFGDEVDILVVGSRGYGPVRRFVLGSTSEYLQRHARCALLVLPRQGGAAR